MKRRRIDNVIDSGSYYKNRLNCISTNNIPEKQLTENKEKNKEEK